MGTDPAHSAVERHLVSRLQQLGFRKRGLRFFSQVGDAEFELELQRSRWGRGQHFLNVSVVYRPQACGQAGVPEGAGIWGRGESIDAPRKEAFLQALEDEVPMEEHERQRRLDALLDDVVLSWLRQVATIAGARQAWAEGRLDAMAFPQLKAHWDPHAVRH